MQRPSLSRSTQPLKRGKTVRIAVLPPKQTKDPNSRSSSDPSRLEEGVTQSIKIQNFATTKTEERAEHTPSILKTKSSNQVGEAEFNLIPVLSESPFKDKAQVIETFANRIAQIHFDQTDPRGKMRSQNEKRVPSTKAEPKRSFLVPNVDNNVKGDRFKSYKFLRPIENKTVEDNYLKLGPNLKELITTLPDNTRQFFTVEENQNAEISLKFEEKPAETTNEPSYQNDISYPGNEVEYPSTQNQTPAMSHKISGADREPELLDAARLPGRRGMESPFLVISQLDIQGTRINKQQVLPGQNPFSPKKISRNKNFRIQNNSPQKQRIRPPTSPSQPNQQQQASSPQKDDESRTPDIRSNNCSSGMWATNPTSMSTTESCMTTIKAKKDISPPKARKDWRHNLCADVTKINEIKQQVLNSEWSTSHVTEKVQPDGDLIDDNVSQDLEFEEDEETNSQTSRTLNKKVLLLDSVYSGRPPTVFFPYPTCCEQVRDASRTHAITAEEEKIYDFKYKAPLMNVLKRTFDTAGFKWTDEANWNVVWAQPKYDRVKDMNRYQKTNHFPGCWEVGRKDGLWRNLSKMKRQFPVEYNFIPTTYLLSTDYDRFVQIKEAADNKAIWIMKPCASACGRGIKIINKATKLSKNPNYLVSEYIANPHLINGLKYDLRVYVLVSSYDPLRVYLFKEGLVRFATEKYSTKKKHLKQRFAHLTNWSVNKHSTKFVKNENAECDGEGSKWSFAALRRKFEEMEISYDGIFDKIKDIITKTLISAEPLMLSSFNRTQEHRNNCFELYGFDILIDSNLKPWLMEVNVCASLNSSSPLDRKIKTSLICDIMNLVGVQPYSKKKIEEEAKNKLYGFESRKLFAKTYYEMNDLDETNCVEKLSADDWNVLFETDEEWHRKGGFERIFPLKENVNTYSKFFEYQRYNNILVWQWLKAKTNFLEKISKKMSDVPV